MTLKNEVKNTIMQGGPVIRMGDVILWNKPFADYDFYAGWDNSYQTDFPYICVLFYENEELKSERISLTNTIEGGNAYYINKAIVSIPDKVQETKYKNYLAALEEQRHEAEILRDKMRVEKYKTVKVVRGRKVPKGTIGRVFWMGDSGYGESVGLELADGKKVFTAKTNVEVIL